MRTRLIWLGLLCFGCGDDTTSGASDTDGTDTIAPSTTAMPSTSGDTDATTDTPSSSGVDPDSSSSGDPTDGSSGSSSSSGTPNTDPDAAGDYYLTNTLAETLDVDEAEGVLANDVDADDDPLSVDSFDAATEQGGVVDMADDGSFTYTAPDAYFGEDRFTYTATDGAGGMSTATVRVMVAPTAEPLDQVSGVGGFVIDPENAGDHLGASVRGIGDINGDGLHDVVLGADFFASDTGVAYVVFGKNDTDAVDVGALGSGGFQIDGEGADQGTGYSVAVIGDVNGDGLADVAIGRFNDGEPDGRAYVVFGKADTNAVDLSAIAGGTGGFAIEDGGSSPTAFGYAVDGAGDVNGDGLQDIIVGAPATNPGGAANGGVAYVIFGKVGTGLVDVDALGGQGFAIESSTAGARLGESVGGAGDVNGDGIDDVVVGASEFSGFAGFGAVVWGKTGDTNAVTEAGLSAGTGGFLVLGGAGQDRIGRFIDGAGDVNGDGLADVVVGAWGTSLDKGFAQGRAYVAFGKADTATVDVSDLVGGTGGFVLDGEADGDFAGWSVAGAGDLNGDGLADLLVGAQGADFNGGTSGRAYAVFGRGDDSTPVALADVALGMGGFALDGEGLFFTTGWATDGAGDVNGDGFADLVVGSPRFSNFTGRAHVVWGGDYLGLIDVPGSARADVLAGGAEVNLFVGGSGDDELDGGGGTDVLYGGPGDDLIVLSETEFFRIDGGTGVDTVRLPGDGEALDLTNFLEVSFQSIEVIDLGDMGDNSVFLELRDVRAMSPESNTLFITGDDGDQAVIDLSGGSFADQGSAGGVTTYSDGVLTIEIADAVEAFVSL